MFTRYRCLGVLALLVCLFPGPVRGQATTADTLAITIEGDLAGVTFETFEVSLRIGDTVQYVGQAYDSEGDPVNSGIVYTYVSTDPTALQIDASTGLAVALSKATVNVIVRAEYGGLVMRTGFLDAAGELQWAGRTARELGIDGTVPIEGLETTVQICGFLVDADEFLVAESPGPPVCPIVFFPRPTARAYPMFASVSRVRPDLFVLGTPG